MQSDLGKVLTTHIENGADLFANLDNYCDIIVDQDLGIGGFFETFEGMLRDMRAFRSRGAVSERVKVLQAITAIPLNLYETRARLTTENAEVALKIPQIADETSMFPYWVNRVLAHLTDPSGKREARDYAIRVVLSYHTVNQEVERLLKLFLVTRPRFSSYLPVPFASSSTFTRQLSVPARESLSVRKVLLQSDASDAFANSGNLGAAGRTHCPNCGYRLRSRADNGACTYCMRNEEIRSMIRGMKASAAGRKREEVAGQRPEDLHYARSYGVAAEVWEAAGCQDDAITNIAVLKAEELAG